MGEHCAVRSQSVCLLILSNILHQKIESKGEWILSCPDEDTEWHRSWSCFRAQSAFDRNTWHRYKFHCEDVTVIKKRKSSCKKSASIWVECFAVWDDLRVGSYILVNEVSLTHHLPCPGKTVEESGKDTKLGVRTHGSCHFTSLGLGFLLYTTRGKKSLFLESLLTLKVYYYLIILILNIINDVTFNDLITTNGKLYFRIKVELLISKFVNVEVDFYVFLRSSMFLEVSSIDRRIQLHLEFGFVSLPLCCCPSIPSSLLPSDIYWSITMC